MASAAQVLANRSNARRSTGPRTPEGKATVAQNAVKHGLLAREAVIKSEDPGQFEFYRDQMLGELAPVDSVESMLAERVVSLSWRLQRAERLQNEAFDAMYLKEATSDYGKMMRARMSQGLKDSPEAGADDLVGGQVVVEDFANSKVLDRLLMYERRIEQSLYRTMAELQRQRLLRELDPPAEGPMPEAASAVCRVPVRASDSEVCRVGLAPPRPARGEESVGQAPPYSSPEEVGRGRPTLDQVEGRLYEEGRVPNRDGSRLGARAQTRKIAIGSRETPDGPGSSPGQAPPAKAGVTMNAPAAEDLSCETNPICPGQNESQVPCGRGVMDDPSQNGHGKTKPISPAWLSCAPVTGTPAQQAVEGASTRSQVVRDGPNAMDHVLGGEAERPCSPEIAELHSR